MRITRPFVLLALAALLAPRAEASRTGAWGSNPPSSIVRSDAATARASLALAAPLDASALPDAEAAESPLFDLGDVVLADTADADATRFDLGPLTLVDLNLLRGPPPSYPETRVGGFEPLQATTQRTRSSTAVTWRGRPREPRRNWPSSAGRSA